MPEPGITETRAYQREAALMLATLKLGRPSKSSGKARRHARKGHKVRQNGSAV